MTTSAPPPHGQLSHDRFCEEIVAQTGLLTEQLAGADLTATVPTCPDWSVRELAEHIGSAHRWAEAMVRTRAAGELSEDDVPDRAPADDGPATLGTWLDDGARRLADTLRAAGPDTPCWSWAWQHDSGFWARRMAHETVIHRADAALAAKAGYDVVPEIAADAIDEWLRIVRYVQDIDARDSAQELKAGGRTLHLHATDTAPELGAEWLIELRDEGVVWRRDHAKADVALRGPLTAVLLAFYRREPLDGGRVEVLGDRALLDFWLARASFG
ncbi:maleylpyruvate isomerase N-terminal domain-containing protein [Streptomyces kunmingensis]|uniref:Maleylpyruvate isomerase N-terminal domain-containing protein n=1 Tax=Streptomyces kunmingensis TaxID=68225 RepID=A0ABU6C6S7_9ACTN|nr:maleylpyruvate isomerase N-terminal domain-containing protein [Streptomyces kunmingensis]MEB3960312.1 maleylpyruvate isomerase N-terminal domain-containing protein [Streptomyces kunmingensis]